MEVESAKVLDNGRRIVVDLKRKRAAQCLADVTGAAFMGAKCPALDSVPEMLCKRMKSDESNSFGSYVKKSFLRNYSNFVKSGMPQRVLFYESCEWTDFPDSIISKAKEAIQLKRTAIEVEFKDQPSLLDFLHMILVDLKTGLQMPIAWIDEAGGCFFPETYSNYEEGYDCFQSGGKVNHSVMYPATSETQEIKLQLEIEVNADRSKMEECSEESNTHIKQFNIEDKPARNPYEVEQSNNAKQVTEVKEASGGDKLSDANPPLNTAVEFMYRVLMPDTVKRMFFKGIGASLCTKDIFGIQCSSSYGAQARLEMFKKQAEITEKYRGIANVRFAWLASSKEAVARILKHGLGFDDLSKSRPACGIGIHLSSENYSCISASYSDVDENGIQHMVLCRVILGNMEAINPGFKPNKDIYDSAVDNLQDPKHYFVWNTNMSNIFPEYVISFRMPQNEKAYRDVSKSSAEVSGITISSQEKLQSSSSPVDSVPYHEHSPNSVEISQGTSSTVTFVEKPPTSPWMPFPLLFAALEEKVSANSMQMLNLCYDKFKKKELSREDFVKRLRMVTGDKLLRDTILVLNSKLPGRDSANQKQEEPARESANWKQEPAGEIFAKQLPGRESANQEQDPAHDSDNWKQEPVHEHEAIIFSKPLPGRESANKKYEPVRESVNLNLELVREPLQLFPKELLPVRESANRKQKPVREAPMIPKSEATIP